MTANETNATTGRKTYLDAGRVRGGGAGGTGWGLEVMSLQRDWAHVEWNAEMLVPDGDDWSEPEACRLLSAGAKASKDGFMLRAAALAEVR